MSAPTELAFGIEEEFFVVDRDTGALEPQAHDRFVATARQLSDGAVSRELLQSQIEIATPICRDARDARHHLIRLRHALARASEQHRLAVIAAGTHPTAEWSEQVQTRKPRYESVVEELQILAPRNLICGMHVHVGLPDNDMRIDVMRRAIPFLPLFVVLSSSSPFWRGMKTGFASYRMTSNDEMPRSGLPPLFDNWAQYQDYIAVMQEAGIISDPSYIWWAIRPSHAYPTLELRVPDTCTSVGDALAIAALFRCLVRALVMDRGIHAGLDSTGRALSEENKWRAQRFGLRAELIDPFSLDATGAAADIVGRFVDFLYPHAIALECTRELTRVERILSLGTSADRQVAIFDVATAEGLAPQAALDRVNAWLRNETQSGCVDAAVRVH